MKRTLAGILAMLALVPGLWLVSCARLRHGEVRSFVEEPFPRRLSEWHLFDAAKPRLQPNRGVIPYDLNTPLFSDYARKYRFVWMPPGTSADYRDDGPFEFPVGTILAKSFAFPAPGRPGEERLIETRLLVHTKSGWVALPYIWDEQQEEATLQLVPDPVEVSWSDASGNSRKFLYSIPNVNECKQCHERDRVMLPIGPKARNLNKDYAYSGETANQLAYWTKVGYLQGAPSPETAPRAAQWDDPHTGSLEARARAYLDNNCAHCHQPGGAAGYTGVDLRLTQMDPRRLGACKSPSSAGRVGDLRYDLVPGSPDNSILLYRMQSTAPKVMMPAIGRSVTHAEGVALIRQWVASLSGGCAGDSELHRSVREQ